MEHLAVGQAKFEAAGAPGARFGSGWVWLVVTADKSPCSDAVDISCKILTHVPISTWNMRRFFHRQARMMRNVSWLGLADRVT